MTIGEKIRTLRKKNGLTQETVASVLEVSRQAIAKWESDQSSPTTENLLKLANLFDISLEELIDLKEFQTPALEEYARKKLEEEKAREKRKGRMIQYTKETLLTLFIYFTIYSIGYCLFILAGVKNYIWDWISHYHVLLITSLVAIVATLMKKKRLSLALLIGTVLSIFIGNLIGALSTAQSIIGFNSGWIGYLLTTCLALVIGYFIEFIVCTSEDKVLLRKSKKFLVLSLILFALIVSACFVSVRAIKYKIAAESGYQHGFEIGVMSAENNLDMNPQFTENYYPEEYTFGSKEFKGYALYWQEGYEAGYSRERE